MATKDRGVLGIVWENLTHIWRWPNGVVQNVRRASASSSTRKRPRSDQAGESDIPEIIQNNRASEVKGYVNVPLDLATSYSSKAFERSVISDTSSFSRPYAGEEPTRDLLKGSQMELEAKLDTVEPTPGHSKVDVRVIEQIDTIRKEFLRLSRYRQDLERTQSQIRYKYDELNWDIARIGDALRDWSAASDIKQKKIFQRLTAEPANIETRLSALRKSQEASNALKEKLFGQEGRIRKRVDYLASIVPGTKLDADLMSIAEEETPPINKRDERPPLLTRYFHRRGDLNLLRDQLDDISEYYWEEKALRQRQQEQELEKELSDETFEQQRLENSAFESEHDEELKRLNADIKTAEKDVEELREECHLMGYDTADDKNYSSSDSASFEDKRYDPSGDRSRVPTIESLIVGVSDDPKLSNTSLLGSRNPSLDSDQVEQWIDQIGVGESDEPETHGTNP